MKKLLHDKKCSTNNSWAILENSMVYWAHSMNASYLPMSYFKNDIIILVYK